MAASSKTGWYGGTMTEKEIESYTDPRGKNYDPNWNRSKIDAFNKEMGITYGKDKDDSKTKKSPTLKSLPTDRDKLFTPDDIVSTTPPSPNTGIPTGVDDYATTDNIYSSFQDTTPQVDYSDDGGDDPGGDSGGGDSSDMGFSTASGGFIQRKNLPKANKKKMKRGGLASRR